MSDRRRLEFELRFLFSNASGRVGWALALLLGLMVAPRTDLRAAGESAIPAADFFKRPDFAGLKLSPSGKRMAALVASQEGRMQLAVFETDDLTKSRIVASYRNADVASVDWVNDDRLVYSLADRQRALLEQGQGRGLYAVGADGASQPRTVIHEQYALDWSATHYIQRALDPNHLLDSVLRDGSNDVLVDRYAFSNAGELESIALLRVNTVTGEVKGLSQGAPPHVFDWTVDAQGRPRAVLTQWDGKEKLFWKPQADGPWVQVSESALFENHNLGPIYVDSDDRMYAAAPSEDPAGTSALIRIDMASDGAKRTPLFSAEGYDFIGSLVRNSKGSVLGIRYLTDARSTYWFDPDLKKIQERIDTLLPGTNNRLDCGGCDQHGKILVTSTSDRQPGAHYLYDVAADKLASVAQSRPWIKPKGMAMRDMVRIQARDGLSLPVHVTRPAGVQGAAPMVVLVHGGPYVRGGEWHWDADSQFLASRGYVVIEPEFRGSLGFGWRHFHAGWKEWGMKMQDDVADAARWAIKQGYADPKRVCIAGASYGGYAALMGLIRDPNLYRCGVDYFGVTDIDLLYSITWSDADAQYQRYGMPVLIGDREKDAAQLAATSPIKLASRVTQPLLMAYGADDRRVPIDHGVKFRDAVSATNKQVDWVVYPEEGHGFRLPEDKIDFWTRVDKFLDKNLKNAP